MDAKLLHSISVELDDEERGAITSAAGKSASALDVA